METIQEEKHKSRGVTLVEKVRDLEKKVKIQEKKIEAKKKTREFKWPFKWRAKFKQSKKKANREMVLVVFLNKKNQMEIPKFMPIFEGNMVVYKNKPYEFDPRAIWTVLGMKGNPQAYLIKEIDRRPVRNKFGRGIYTDAAVSNMDLDEVRARGDSTESDEFLIKAALSAKISSLNKKISSTALWIGGLVVVGIIIYLLASSGGSA